MRAEPGWDPDFHPTPRVQLGITLAGRIRLAVTDGTEIDGFPGAIPTLLSDVNCRGHRTMVLGNEPAVFMLVGLPVD